MAVVPLAKPAKQSAPVHKCCCTLQLPWARIAAAGTLIVGGGLLLGGKRKPGLVAAAAGASLAALDQQDTIRAWWNELPEYIGNAQNLLGQVQETLDTVSEQRDKLAKALHR
ncbi:MAG: hypothetical protein P4K83_01960 [Terracidiphilus sp.]|nr:hypothetical protein [Terracidiphilus sp.]